MPVPGAQCPDLGASADTVPWCPHPGANARCPGPGASARIPVPRCWYRYPTPGCRCQCPDPDAGSRCRCRWPPAVAVRWRARGARPPAGRENRAFCRKTCCRAPGCPPGQGCHGDTQRPARPGLVTDTRPPRPPEQGMRGGLAAEPFPASAPSGALGSINSEPKPRPCVSPLNSSSPFSGMSLDWAWGAAGAAVS